MGGAAIVVEPFVLKVICVTLGVATLYFLRDPIQLYVQDVTFKNFEAKERRVVVSLNQLMFKIGTLLQSLLATFVLLKLSVAHTILIFVPICVAMIVVAVMLSAKLSRIKKAKEAELASNEAIEEKQK